MVLSAKNVYKTIKKKTILQDVTINLCSGSVYGFVGRNGSGKTMLFRALSGLMSIDKGAVSLDDKVLSKDFSVLPRLGIVLENAGLYPEYTGYRNLELLAKLNGVADQSAIKSAILRVGLDPADKRSYRKYSLGMKQRIAIAQAIMEKPDIIMLDEPTNSLDESGVACIRDIVREEKDRGALILLASHNKEDIQLLSDHIFHMEDGLLSEVKVF
ncbi:ATP-binding cassette domain-containing protein [Lachnospiraceae bacterium ZAX-1]